MTRRRWIADEWKEGTAFLRNEQANHLTRVLRAQVGMEFDVVAGETVWRAAISAIGEDFVTFDLLAELEADAALPVTLLLSIFKFDRMEWALEKATELGVGTIIPVVARRTEKHLTQAAGKRIERWRRIALEAAKQSRRSKIPEVLDPLPLKAALASLANAAETTVKLLLAENEKQTTLASALEEHGSALATGICSVAVGPEGGWTEEELSLFRTEGWIAVSLGPRILRAETAAIAALAIVGSVLNG